MRSSHHTFHIPVMGLAFTIDTPIKVARFGISSVISIIEDNLIEKMRSYYYPKINEKYKPISSRVPDYRAKRITDYLNLVDKIVSHQVEILRNETFEPGSEISKYFEMLPESHVLKQIYEQLDHKEPEDRAQFEDWLRKQIVPGNIDVNIMTKVDRNRTNTKGNEIEDGSDAVVSLRGYARSNLTNSSVILSAGMNPRLFNYLEKLRIFDADDKGNFAKRIAIKVSDYRSALIQGKMLAKKGIWVNEFRIESGLNCGGHAFATDGYLMGPILEEFKSKKEELIYTLHEIYCKALIEKGRKVFVKPHPVRITAQGGIGTHDEDYFLRKYYGLDGTGWGTPFLLVPEATTVDEETLRLLTKAKEEDVTLSNNSPLGVRFYYLKGTSADIEKMDRIEKGSPGSPCTEKFLISNTEFGTPLCTASQVYQKKKLEQLQSLDLTVEDYNLQRKAILDKECLCIGLANAAIKSYKLKPIKNLESVNICPGPNIAYFEEVVSLKKMLDHIYGRINILKGDARPNMFIKELKLYINYWNELLTEAKGVIDAKRKKYIHDFYKNMTEGMEYYKNLANKVGEEFSTIKDKIESGLDEAEYMLGKLSVSHLIE